MLRCPSTAVADQVSVGVEAFRRRVDALDESARTPELLERVAEDVWGGASVADLPLRVAHAAERLGFLGREGDVRASASGAWRRLGCPGGSILWSPKSRERRPALPGRLRPLRAAQGNLVTNPIGR